MSLPARDYLVLGAGAGSVGDRGLASVIGHGSDAGSGNRAPVESGGSVAEQDSATGDQPSSNGLYTPRAVSRRPLGCLIEIAETLILTIVIFWLIQTFVAQPFQVQQQSMSGTLEEGQYVLVDKLSPNFDPYNRGDIVVFTPTLRAVSCTDPVEQPPDADATPYIKRVIGEPGDTVELINGDVYVNGATIEEPYVFGADSRPMGSGDTWTVPAGRLFVMGDNRDNSTDSRSDQIGMVCTNDVVGRAWLRYWPVNTLGILQTPTYPNVPTPSAAQSTAAP